MRGLGNSRAGKKSVDGLSLLRGICSFVKDFLKGNFSLAETAYGMSTARVFVE